MAMACSSISAALPILLMLSGYVVGIRGVTFHVANKCPFPVWPAAAPNAGHQVIAGGGFLLQPGQSRRVTAPAGWNGRLWGRTGCNFSSGSSNGAACQTGDCHGLLACNGSIGAPPATLVEVSLHEDRSKPSFYDVSLVDGYNLPVSVSTKPASRNCTVAGCTKNVNSVCPQELQVAAASSGRGKAGRDVVACKSACLAFDLDAFCCRNSYGTPETCRGSVYSKVFKDACPAYFSYAYDSTAALVNCHSDAYVVSFCPSRWGEGVVDRVARM